MEQIDALISELKGAEEERIEAIKAELVTLCSGPDGGEVRSHIEKEARSQVLLVQWELEEVIEATEPAKPAPAPEPEPEPEAAPEPEAPEANAPLNAADLDMVYDDPRGLVLHRTKDGQRWFATQVDPQSGQPQTFELQQQEIQQLKAQLVGSPYWLGSAGLAGA